MMKYFVPLIFIFGVLADVSDIYDYSYYPQHDSVLAWIADISAEYPDLCHAESLGFSTRDSLPIWGIKISDNASENEDEMAVFINGSIHAEEVIGTIICQFAAETLLASYGLDSTITRWIDELEIWFVPVVNPEGYQVVVDGLDYTYRKNKRDNNGDGRFSYVYYHGNDTDGVDLNRNFPFNWDGIDAVYDMWSSFYSGPSAGSESETQAMMRLCERERFVSSVWYHSSATGLLNEKVFYPWGWGDCPDFSRNSRIGLQMSNRMMSYRGAAYISGPVDKQYGSSIDWEYAKYATASLIVEVDTTTQPDTSLWDYQLHNQWNGLVYLFDRVLGEAIIVHTYAAGVDTPVVARVEIAGTTADYLPPRMTEPIYGSMRRLVNYGDHEIIVSCMDLVDTFSVTVERNEPFYLDVYLELENIEESQPLRPSLDVYPNPFNGGCQILTPNKCYITVFDVHGRQLLEAKSNGIFFWQPEDALPSGIYTVTASDELGLLLKQSILYLK